ncbi:hypothetical protein [Trichoplusia ni ascovirus 6b]|nr:hypothetical protein [Trichoplusia ni ascovirus 6b]
MSPDDYVRVTLNDEEKTSISFRMDDPNVKDWLKQLSSGVDVKTEIVEDEDDERYNFLIQLPLNFWNRCRSAMWGACEGAATGIATGSNVSGAGWWIIGTIGQMCGAFAGITIGTPVFATLGFLSDMDTVRELMTDYRHAFGKVEYTSVTNSNSNAAATLMAILNGLNSHSDEIIKKRTKIN